MKILNLYAGIGGNRKLWGDEHEVTAVENDPEIAAIYKEYFPNDTVIVGDAHEYLLKHYKEFDFIWSSPVCKTHSRTNYFLNAQGIVRYPDMSLYQEIIFLTHFFNGLFCVENVIGYYEPLIKPQEVARHYFWSNFKITQIEIPTHIGRMCGKKEDLGAAQWELRRDRFEGLGFDLTRFKVKDKDQLIRNCVNPKLGLHILEQAQGIIRQENIIQPDLFNPY